jgi:sulfatase maturation enzyme AslB (radical SAM superfamily)
MTKLNFKNLEKPVEVVDQIQNKIYSKMSFYEKLERVQQLKEIAWQLKSANLKTKYPDWTEQQIQNEIQKIFLYATT